MIKIPKGSSFALISHRLQKLIWGFYHIYSTCKTRMSKSRIIRRSKSKSSRMKWKPYSEYQTERLSWVCNNTHFLNKMKKQLLYSPKQFWSDLLPVELRELHRGRQRRKKRRLLFSVVQKWTRAQTTVTSMGLVGLWSNPNGWELRHGLQIWLRLMGKFFGSGNDDFYMTECDKKLLGKSHSFRISRRKFLTLKSEYMPNIAFFWD